MKSLVITLPKRLYIVVLLFLGNYCLLYPQNKTISFDHFTVEDGLSQMVVTSIYQDKEGLLWFGTQNGLNKYDGYKYTVYKNKPFDSTSLTDPWIQSITEDKKGNLWIGSQTGGIFKFDKNTQQFTNYRHIQDDPSSLLNNRVWATYIDRNNMLWVGSSGGLDRFNIAAEEFVHFKHDNNNPNSLSKHAVNAICEDADGNLWIGTYGGGLNKLDRKYKDETDEKNINFEHITFNDNIGANYGSNNIKTIYEDKEGFLWVGTLAGLIRFNKKDYNHTVYYIVNSKNFIPNQNSILSILEDKRGQMWVGSHSQGLNLFDRKSGEFTSFKRDPLKSKSLSDNWVSALYEDFSGVIWIATGRGINKILPLAQYFKHYKNHLADTTKFNSNEIISILEDSKGTIWLGTWGGGLVKFDMHTGKFKNYVNKANDSNSIPDNIVWCIYEDSKANLWVGTYAGLSIFNRKTEKFNRNPLPDAALSYNNISCIYEDTFNNLWVGTWGGGLNKLEKRGKKFIQYKSNPDNKSSISGNFITCICEDKKHNLWVGTNAGGLNLYNYKDNNFRAFRYNSKDTSSISNNSIRRIYEDKHGVIWVATWGGGLNKFDDKTGKFTHFTEESGLLNNVIYGILGDDNNNLWLSTNGGLSKFNTATHKFINYDIEDGLGNSQYSTGHRRLKDGAMIWGGTNGFTVFNPDNIPQNKHIPPVIITSFKLFNNEVKFNRELSRIKEINLNYDQNVISIEFAALDYSNPNKNYYAYILQGFDKEWTYSKNERSAHYTNLDHGRYVFKVKGSNNDQVWNNKVTSVIINIIPPFWHTWWFKIIVILTLTAGILAVYALRMQSIKRNNKVLENLVHHRTKELENEITYRKNIEAALKKSELKLRELNANKDKIFSLIAHDLKSPFFSLLGFANLLDEEIHTYSFEEIKSSVGSMTRSVKKLAELTENLLQWSKFQAGTLEYKPSSLQLNEVVNHSLNLLELDAAKKNISIKNFIHKDIKIFADGNMLNSVIQNLVANAIKFTNNGGYIEISSVKKDKYIEVRVKDNGVGISKENIDKLFRLEKQFSTAGTNDEMGTGLGLILSRELLEKNGGKIWAESTIGEGSSFIFTIPLANH